MNVSLCVLFATLLFYSLCLFRHEPGVGGRGLILGVLNMFPISTGWWICVLVSHDVVPLATPSPFKVVFSFSGKGKACIHPFPTLHLVLQKDNFFQNQKDSTSLTWGIQLRCQGTSNAQQLLKIWLCICGVLSELWVFKELLGWSCYGCEQAAPERWTELPLIFKRSGEVWAYTALQSWSSPSSPADTI